LLAVLGRGRNMQKLVIFFLILSTTSFLYGATSEFKLRSDDWSKQARCLTDVLNSLSGIGKRVRKVTFPQVTRNPLYSAKIGTEAVATGRQGLARWVNIKMKAAPGSQFYGTSAGSKYYNFKIVKTIQLDSQSGHYTPGYAQCEAEVYNSRDYYPFATIDVCRCLP